MKIVNLSWLMVLVLLLHPAPVSSEVAKSRRARMGRVIIEAWEARWTEVQSEETLEVGFHYVNRGAEEVTLTVSLWQSGVKFYKPHGEESIVVHPGESGRQNFIFKVPNRSDKYSIYIRSKEGEALVAVQKDMFAAPTGAALGAMDDETAELLKEGHKEYFAKIPQAYYLPYKAENYLACYGNGCHDQIIETDYSYQGTNFRNSYINLHYQHVNRSENGWNCKACHTAEATDQDKMIRKEVPYKNKWMLPVNYTKNSIGGQCVVGCHRNLAYYREFRFD